MAQQLLRILIISGLLGSPATFAAGPSSSAKKNNGNTFYDTTGGANGREAYQDKNGNIKNGGLSDEEIAQMNADEQRIYNNLRDGRYPSSKSTKTRFSTKLEIHDANFDGITDHDGAENGLEGPMDEVAIGKKATSGQARAKAMREKTQENPFSKCSKNPSDNGACQNISPILVDVGPAHSSDKNSPHRVYELVPDAIKKSQQSGKEYAAAVVEDATNRKGFDEVQKVYPDIDLLRSEVAYLETVKDTVIRNAWRSMRANRLAGEETKFSKNNLGSSVNNEISSLAAEGDDNALANRIAVRDVVGSSQVCNPSQGAAARLCTPDEISKCGPTDDRGNLIRAVSASSTPTDPNNQLIPCWDLKKYADNIDQSIVAKAESMYRQAEADPDIVTNDQRKKIAEKEKKILRCMGAGVWCYDYEHAKNSLAKSKLPPGKLEAEIDKRTFGDVVGDYGNAYDYTREAMYSALDIARQRPISDWEKNFNTIDFSVATDAKTKSKPYAAMMKEVNDARNRAEMMRKEALAGDNDMRARGFNVEDSYFTRDEYFNPKTMTVQQLFGRNPARDGVTQIDHSKDWEQYLNAADPLGDVGNFGASDSSPSPAASTPATGTISPNI